MSGPPHWLAYACAVSLWTVAGCVAMAGVAAVLDWLSPQQARDGPERGLSRPRGPIATPSQERAQRGAQSRRLVPRPQPEPQTRTNHTDMETR